MRRRRAAERAAAAARALGIAVALVGCGAPPPPAPPPSPPPVPVATPRDPLASEPIGIFRSKRFDLVLPLPDGKGFAIDDTRGPWLVARHAGSSSTLLVRRWRELESIGREGCEAVARRARSLPSLDAADVIDVRNLAIPPDHDTIATAALFRPPPRPPATTAPLYGMVLAFGAWSTQCFAFAFVTELEGPGAEAIVAERLVRVMDQSLAAIRARSDLDPSLERDAPPAPR